MENDCAKMNALELPPLSQGNEEYPLLSKEDIFLFPLREKATNLALNQHSAIPCSDAGTDKSFLFDCATISPNPIDLTLQNTNKKKHTKKTKGQTPSLGVADCANISPIDEDHDGLELNDGTKFILSSTRKDSKLDFISDSRLIIPRQNEEKTSHYELSSDSIYTFSGASTPHSNSLEILSEKYSNQTLPPPSLSRQVSLKGTKSRTGRLS